MTVLQSATAERVASNYRTIWVGVLGPPGDPDMGGTETIAHVSEGAPSVVVLNVVSDLYRSDVTVEEADAEPEGEPPASSGRRGTTTRTKAGTPGRPPKVGG